MIAKIIISSIVFPSIALMYSAQTQPAQHRGNEPSSSSARKSLPGDKPIVLTSDLVSLSVIVTDDQGRSVAGLSKSAFQVLDEGVPQEISFFRDQDTPASVAVVFDVSDSMSEDKIGRAKEALAHFIQTSHPEDEYFLITFNSTPRLVLDGVRDGEAVLKKFTYVRPQGKTALYDAVYLGVEKVSQGVYPKKAVILISDGEDNHSLYSRGEVSRRLQESDVVIYTVRVGFFMMRRGRHIMEDLASISAGKSFSPTDRKGMFDTFEDIALELRRQYAIAFVPFTSGANSRWRRVKIKVTANGSTRLSVRHRKGYVPVR